ncbi:hypothetical protein IJ182_03015 [bacterium]|nr:hypothetical protein [bacterium]
MKKIIAILLLILILNFSCPYSYVAFATGKGGLKIEKNNSKYGLYEKSLKGEILPSKYDKIKKIKFDSKILYIAETDLYITLYSPDGLYNDFLKQYYASNKVNSNVKFNNYPEIGTIRYKQNNKYGIIVVDKDRLHITKPLFDKVIFPDENSVAAKFLDISFAPSELIVAYYNYSKDKYIFQNLKQILNNENEFFNFKIFIQPAEITEIIDINNGVMTVNYEKANYFNNNFEIKKIVPYLENISNLDEIYYMADKYSGIKYINYPTAAMLKSGHKLYIFNDNKEEILVPCSDFLVQNSIFKITTGIDISFQSPENIIAKNGKWGIINSKNIVKVPFIYDEIYPLNSYTEEEVSSDKKEIIYKKSNDSILYLARKGFGAGIIDEYNNVIVPFEYKRELNNKQILALQAQINNKIQSDNDKAARNNFKHELPYAILNLLLLPVWLLTPYPFNGYVHIDYK